MQYRASLAVADYYDSIVAHPDAIDLPLDQLSMGYVFVAERDGEIVGFSAVLPQPNGSAEVDGLFVEPSAWRKGIGLQLIRDAERRARLSGATSLRVIANPAAERFYLACGFTFEAEEQTRFGPARTMRKPL